MGEPMQWSVRFCGRRSIIRTKESLAAAATAFGMRHSEPASRKSRCSGKFAFDRSCLLLIKLVGDCFLYVECSAIRALCSITVGFSSDHALEPLCDRKEIRVSNGIVVAHGPWAAQHSLLSL